MRAVVVLAILLAGCSNPAPWSDGHSSSSTSSSLSPWTLNVPSGEWIAFEPGADSQGLFHLDIGGRVDFDGPGVNTVDSFECSVVGVGGEWFAHRLPSRPFGGSFAGSRNVTGDTWLNVRMGEGSVAKGGALTGAPDDIDGQVIAAQVQVGNAVSNLTVESEAGGRITMRGRYWCLDGPSLWEGGSYRVSPTSFNVSDLTWQANVEKGLLVRVETSLFGGEDIDLGLTAPNGTAAALPPGPDLTFCSEQPGTWTFGLSSRLRESVGSWHLTISVLDIAGTPFDCHGDWRAAPTL